MKAEVSKPTESWVLVAEQASKEQDNERLLLLIRELNRLLDERALRSRVVSARHSRA